MKPQPITFGSLFAGIGGMELGLERAGMRVQWQVEIDPYCRRVLAKHWPNVKRYEDVREVGASNLESVDLICGGFPCQDISNAGKRAGIEGERSGLWSEFHRIICELRPRYVLVENVRALLVRGIDRVLGDLADGGYDAEWDCIPAAALGAPHIRYRVFILGHALSEGTGHQSRTDSGQRRECARTPKPEAIRQAHGPVSSGWTDAASENVANSKSDGLGRWKQQPQGSEGAGMLADANGFGAECLQKTFQARESGLGGECKRLAKHWSTEPDVGRVAYGVPSRVDRLRGLGNAVVPQVAEWIGRRIVEADRAERVAAL